jgi:hypothetical protein
MMICLCVCFICFVCKVLSPSIRECCTNILKETNNNVFTDILYVDACVHDFFFVQEAACKGVRDEEEQERSTCGVPQRISKRT